MFADELEKQLKLYTYAILEGHIVSFVFDGRKFDLFVYINGDQDIAVSHDKYHLCSVRDFFDENEMIRGKEYVNKWYQELKFNPVK